MSSINNFTSAEKLVSVTLHANPFTTEGSNFYARVTRNTVTLNNLIASIIEKNTGIDAYMIQHSAALLQQAILTELKQGNAVNVLDLGTLFLSVPGAIKGDNPSSTSIPAFQTRFTPSKTVNEAVSQLVVDKIVTSSSNPVIDSIINLFTKSEDGILSAEKSVRISGTHLKIGTENSGIFFAPLDENEEAVTDESLWINVPETLYIRNLPKTLEFFLPDTLVKETSYRIVLRTTLSTNSTVLKEPVSTISKVVKISE